MEKGLFKLTELSNIKFLMECSKDKIIQDKQVDYNGDRLYLTSKIFLKFVTILASKLQNCLIHYKSDFSTFKNRITK